MFFALQPGIPGSDHASETDIDLSLHIGPLLCLTQHPNEFLERLGISRSVFEPGEKVEGLSQVMPMIEAACNPWKIFQARGNMVRTLFEDGSSFVLG